MKKYLKSIYAGISGKQLKNGNYQITVDFDNNSKTDIIQFLKPYRTRLDNNTYWFGYKYNEGISNAKLYRAFIDFIKDVQEDDSVEYVLNDEGLYVPYSPDHITESEIETMIIRSFDGINISKYNIDSVVYPGPSEHNIVSVMIRCIKRYFRDADKMTYTQLNKLASNKVELDRKQFVADLMDGAEDLEGMNIETIYQLQSELEDKGEKPFSIRTDIHPKQLRRYVKEVFQKESEEALINAHKVLIVDDFKTSGTTIRDMVYKVRKCNINSDLVIYIFTLMGRFKD